ncbi:MAG: hypothetical protein JXR70_16235 [Spirochaetales bacterium]|nr:hypothetical protein [Spirochaetales bacterium]
MKKLFVFILLGFSVVNLSAQETKPIIVVMNFYYKDISGGDMSSFTDVVTEALRRTDLYNVMSIEDRDAILLDRKYDIESCVQPSCQSRAAKALNVDLYLTGDIGRLGNKYILHGAIIDAKTGEVFQNLQHDVIYENFLKMRDDMTIFTYRVCHLTEERITQLVESHKDKIIVEGKASVGEIAGIGMFIGGLVAAGVGGYFFYEYYSLWNGNVDNSYKDYLALDSGLPPKEYQDQYEVYKNNFETSKSKFYTGIIVGGAGLLITAIGGVVWGVSANSVKNTADAATVKPTPLFFGAAHNGQLSLSMKLSY